MSVTISEKRMAENQVVFRRYNEAAKKGLDDLQALAKEANQEHLLSDFDAPLHFYCECSDEDCRQRVELHPSKYASIHEHRGRFVIIRGHEVPAIEQIVAKEEIFWIVEKFETPREDVAILKKTKVKNN